MTNPFVADKNVDAQQLDQFEKEILEGEAKTQKAIDAMRKSVESLQTMKSRRDSLLENPSLATDENELSKLENDIKYREIRIEKLNPEARIQELQNTIAMKRLELRQLTAQSTINSINEISSSAPVAPSR